MKIAQREKVVKTSFPVIEDGILAYFLDSRQGPMNWNNLRNANYGSNENNQPLRQATFPEIVRLSGFALQNKDKEVVQPVLEGLRKYWLTGNSLVLWTPEGMYGIDSPTENIVSQLGENSQRDLKIIRESLDKRLSGASQRGKVSFSEDGLVRFTGYDGINYEEQNAETLARNPGVIVLSGSEENAQNLAEGSKTYRFNPFFWGLKNTNKPMLRVPGLYGDFGGGLYVNGYGYDDDGNWCSFGVSDRA